MSPPPSPADWGTNPPAKFKQGDRVVLFWETGRWDLATVLGGDKYHCPYAWLPYGGTWEYAVMIHYMDGGCGTNVAAETQMILLEGEQGEWLNAYWEYGKKWHEKHKGDSWIAPLRMPRIVHPELRASKVIRLWRGMFSR